jgi:hypothetical protein
MKSAELTAKTRKETDISSWMEGYKGIIIAVGIRTAVSWGMTS